MDQLEAAAGVDESCKIRVDGAWRWQCNLCDKNYSTKYSLMTHRVGHSGLKPFVCTDCGKAFKQLSHLNTHQLRHAGLRPHCCTVCGKRFVQGSHLKRHMNTHNPESALYCDLCPRRFTYPSEIRAHKEKMHGPKSKKAKKAAAMNKMKPLMTLLRDLKEMSAKNGDVLKKEDATEETKKDDDPDSHTKKTPQEGPYWQCSQCPIIFPSRDELAAHVAGIHENPDAKPPDEMAVDDSCATQIDGVRRWQCKQCPKTYATKYGLVTHMSDHTGTKPFECTDCGKRFKQLSHLNTHHLRHAGLRPHRCNVCGKRFVQASHLKRHLHTHSSEGAFFCDMCPRKFTYPSELRFHKDKAHSPDKMNGKDRNVRKHVDVVKSTKADTKPDGVSVILCPECGKSFSYQSQLDKHMKRHTNNRPHICKECGMSFMEIHHLNQHAFTHTGIKPHKCPVCSRGFTLEANMKRHVLIHSGIRNFECHICKRRFAQKQTLRAHMIIHSDTKPHACKFCGKAFRRNRNLLCHLRLHTDSKPYKCLSCGLRFNRKGNLKKHQKDKHGMDPSYDFAHFQALNLSDPTLIHSLNDATELHDVVDGNVNKDDLEPGQDIKSGSDDPDKPIADNKSEEDGNAERNGSGENGDNEEQVTIKMELDNSEVSNTQSQEQDSVNQNGANLYHERANYDQDLVDRKLDGGIHKGMLFTGHAFESTGDAHQSVVSDHSLLLQDGSNVSHDDFIFDRDPLDHNSTMFNSEDIKWRADLGQLVDTEMETSSTVDEGSEAQCDNIMNKPRAMISRYFEKKSISGLCLQGMCNDDVELEEDEHRNGLPELDIRMSKRKGLPRKLDNPDADCQWKTVKTLTTEVMCLKYQNEKKKYIELST